MFFVIIAFGKTGILRLSNLAGWAASFSPQDPRMVGNITGFLRVGGMNGREDE